MEGAYLAAAGRAEAELREKGSRFLALVIPVTGEAEARRALEELRRRFPDATHHCWAWRLGAAGAERCSDAGEPAGTAGQPILRVLRGVGISDVLAVVMRWYGGTKLGKGGLARAYAGVVGRALRDLETGRRHPSCILLVELPYERLGAVRRLLHPPEVKILEQSYGERVRLLLAVRAARLPVLREALIGPCGGGAASVHSHYLLSGGWKSNLSTGGEECDE